MPDLISTDHISNSDVYIYYSSIVRKMTNLLSSYKADNSSPLLNDESTKILILMFEKYRIHFYSIVNLTYKGTPDTENGEKYLDISSITLMIRSCYEVYLLFHYIFMQASSISKIFKIESFENYRDVISLRCLLYKHDAYTQTIKAYNQVQKKKNTASLLLNQTILEIRVNPVFVKLQKNEQEILLKKWKKSWADISKETELSKWASTENYNLMSQYAHSSFTALESLDYYNNNPSLYDKDSMNLMLYITTTLFVKDLCRVLHVANEKFMGIFSQDEVNLMNEFYGLALKEPPELGF